MSKSTRRSFIKKNILSGLFLSSAVPLLQANNALKSERYVPALKSYTSDYNRIDWNNIREQFLFAKDYHYLNTGSLGPSPKIVLDTVCEAMEKLETSVSHGRHQIDETHEKAAKFLNVTADEIAFTRNATEGLNIAARSLRLKKGDEIIISTHEHVGGASPWMALAKDFGAVVKLVNLDFSGEKNLQIIKDNITNKTKVVAFSHITCTTGMKLPAKAIVEFCRSKNIYSCIDGAQSLGMFPIDLRDINPDFYASSGHKWLFGPKGTGVLFINKNIIDTISPVFAGAYTDSKFDLNSLTMEYRNSAQREEYGTRNTPITLGLGAAFDFINAIGIDNVAKRSRELVTRFRKGIANTPEIDILTPESERYSASMVTIRIKGKDNLKLNPVLNKEKRLRMRGIYENNINGIRISFAIFNSFEEVDLLVNSLKEVVKK
ncbi:aminotransferase class V-fold PLP-dependent enzyme [Flavobacteriaceae bacterium S0825]|uniref:aminotransferase class V-fold PLP-dependent enzyme n=1 Tax=Gaetbulibacter sp. S0825 TaxID=2720084 RepID=UPI00142FD834|nr:aminotransferase class V-fold PLP-dependent enzyme [Gaetbulibacter sp. S0825]MCK0108929.1 aminotransferase class V-fold PLP-dependent enzyme [Flavobacteriaceae bacterium S0825]NIX64564.1 aminotransferase class V-fold PLP-dependent enzyme [Gaetbulibacter sp. S0825]